VREVTGQKEMVDGLLQGDVSVDYETGAISRDGIGRARLIALANSSSSW